MTQTQAMTQAMTQTQIMTLQRHNFEKTSLTKDFPFISTMINNCSLIVLSLRNSPIEFLIVISKEFPEGEKKKERKNERKRAFEMKRKKNPLFYSVFDLFGRVFRKHMTMKQT